jgi:hypothetical protein
MSLYSEYMDLADRAILISIRRTADLMKSIGETAHSLQISSTRDITREIIQEQNVLSKKYLPLLVDDPAFAVIAPSQEGLDKLPTRPLDEFDRVIARRIFTSLLKYLLPSHDLVSDLKRRLRDLASRKQLLLDDVIERMLMIMWRRIWCLQTTKPIPVHDLFLKMILEGLDGDRRQRIYQIWRQDRPPPHMFPEINPDLELSPLDRADEYLTGIISLGFRYSAAFQSSFEPYIQVPMPQPLFDKIMQHNLEMIRIFSGKPIKEETKQKVIAALTKAMPAMIPSDRTYDLDVSAHASAQDLDTIHRMDEILETGKHLSHIATSDLDDMHYLLQRMRVFGEVILLQSGQSPLSSEYNRLLLNMTEDLTPPEKEKIIDLWKSITPP